MSCTTLARSACETTESPFVSIRSAIPYLEAWAFLILFSPRFRPPLTSKGNWNGLFDLIDLSVPKRVLPRSMVQPGLAMEKACELGTPLRDLHRLDKEFQLMGRFLVSCSSVRVIHLVNRLWRSAQQLSAYIKALGRQRRHRLGQRL